MITYPNAKINLGLNITEKRPDGYHNLETVFYPINLQDALEVKPLEEGCNKEYTLKTSGTPIEGEPENNLARMTGSVPLWRSRVRPLPLMSFSASA